MCSVIQQRPLSFTETEAAQCREWVASRLVEASDDSLLRDAILLRSEYTPGQEGREVPPPQKRPCSGLNPASPPFDLEDCHSALDDRNPGEVVESTALQHTCSDLDSRSTPAQSSSSARTERDQTRALSEQELIQGSQCSAGTRATAGSSGSAGIESLVELSSWGFLAPGGVGRTDGQGTEVVDRLEPLVAPALDPTSTPFEPRVSFSEGPTAGGNWALAEAGELEDI
eukprot:3137600-Rhodomonas_salina.2